MEKEIKKEAKIRKDILSRFMVGKETGEAFACYAGMDDGKPVHGCMRTAVKFDTYQEAKAAADSVGEPGWRVIDIEDYIPKAAKGLRAVLGLDEDIPEDADILKMIPSGRVHYDAETGSWCPIAVFVDGIDDEETAERRNKVLLPQTAYERYAVGHFVDGVLDTLMMDGHEGQHGFEHMRMYHCFRDAQAAAVFADEDGWFVVDFLDFLTYEQRLARERAFKPSDNPDEGNEKALKLKLEWHT